MQVEKACGRLHEMLESLTRWFKPSVNLPSTGIYFFYEEGETSPHTGKQRIVRVGTHGASRILKRRLRDHYNGNREGSVFRKHLGTALLRRGGASESQIREWRRGRRSRFWNEFEKQEREVDEVIRSKFFFRVIRVADVKERRVFEEKAIATLSACSVCRPSERWLGHYAWSEKVRRSGLWNSDFVDSPARLTEKDLVKPKRLVFEI